MPVTDWHVETCCKCKTVFAMTRDFYTIAVQRAEQFEFYCPHGHPQHYVRGESELDKMRRERDRLKQDAARLSDEKAAAMVKAAKLEAAAARHARRAKAGTCPCCKRTFRQLAAHMKTKHPQYATNSTK